MFLSQNRGRDGHMQNALQKLWLIGGTASRTAQKRGETSPTPSSVIKAWRNNQQAFEQFCKASSVWKRRSPNRVNM